MTLGSPVSGMFSHTSVGLVVLVAHGRTCDLLVVEGWGWGSIVGN